MAGGAKLNAAKKGKVEKVKSNQLEFSYNEPVISEIPAVGDIRGKMKCGKLIGGKLETFVKSN